MCVYIHVHIHSLILFFMIRSIDFSRLSKKTCKILRSTGQWHSNGTLGCNHLHQETRWDFWVRMCCLSDQGFALQLFMDHWRVTTVLNCTCPWGVSRETEKKASLAKGREKEKRCSTSFFKYTQRASLCLWMRPLSVRHQMYWEAFEPPGPETGQ